MALLENVIGYGPHADRPTAGSPGAVYFESDTGNGYRDNGLSWDVIASAPAPAAVITTASDLVLSRANVLVVVTADGKTITLPEALENIGQTVTIIPPVGGDFSVSALVTDNLNDTAHRPYTVISAGDTWWQINY